LDLVECSLVYKTWSMDDSFILNLTWLYKKNCF
jgi:hypothetical protein